MSILRYLMIFFLIPVFSFAQEITVVNAETGEPIVNTSVTTAGKKIYRISGTNGRVNLAEFDNDDQLVFSHVAYQVRIIRKNRLLREGRVMALVPLSEELEEVVLSARKWEEPKERIDQRIAAVSREEVLFSNVQTSADLLQSTGKVFVQKSQYGGGSPMIRGFATNRLLITVDGVRMNNAIFRGGNIQNIISIDPMAIASTEVVFGPGAVTYGSDAIGGVMSFYTIEPGVFSRGPGIEGSALLRYATASNERTINATLKYGSRKWAGASVFTYSDFKDLIMGSHGPDDYLRPEYVVRQNGEDVVMSNDNPKKQAPTGYEQISLLQKVTYNAGEFWKLKGSLQFSTTGDYSRYDRLTRYRDGLPRAAQWYYGPQQWFMGSVVAEHMASNSLYDKLRLTNAYQQFGESRHDRDFNQEELYVTRERVDAFSSNLDLEKHLGIRSTLHYGLEYVFNRVGSEGFSRNIVTGSETTTASRYPDNSRWQSLAAYANYKYQPDRRVTLRGGIRYNYLDSYSDFEANNAFYNFPFSEARLNTDALTGSASVQWSPNRIFQGHLQLSTAYRAPNIDDTGKIFDSEPGAVVVPNPDLKPEYAYNAEVGVALNMKEKLKFDLSLYHTWLEDAMVRRDFTYEGVSQIEYNGELSDIQAIQNASEARVYGVEAGVNWRLSNALNARGTISWVEGEEILDDGSTSPLRHAAPVFGQAALEWKNDRVKVDLWTQFNGELAYEDMAVSEQGKAYLYALDANGNPYAPAWYTVNLRGAYEMFESTTIQVALENMTDQRYRTYSSGIAAPGLNLILSLRQSF